MLRRQGWAGDGGVLPPGGLGVRVTEGAFSTEKLLEIKTSWTLLGRMEADKPGLLESTQGCVAGAGLHSVAWEHPSQDTSAVRCHLC